jgi:hypothetical protein
MRCEHDAADSTKVPLESAPGTALPDKHAGFSSTLPPMLFCLKYPGPRDSGAQITWATPESDDAPQLQTGRPARASLVLDKWRRSLRRLREFLQRTAVGRPSVELGNRDTGVSSCHDSPGDPAEGLAGGGQARGHFATKEALGPFWLYCPSMYRCGMLPLSHRRSLWPLHLLHWNNCRPRTPPR